MSQWITHRPNSRTVVVEVPHVPGVFRHGETLDEIDGAESMFSVICHPFWYST
jgi:hypothetical protein